MQIVNDEVLNRFRMARQCEYCFIRAPHGCHPHHIFCRGSGGGSRLDIPPNLVALCYLCHTAHHLGLNPKTSELLEIASRRHGTTPDAIRSIIQECRNYRSIKMGMQLPKEIEDKCLLLAMTDGVGHPPENAPKKVKLGGKIKDGQSAQKTFDALCKAAGLPVPEHEYQFCDDRKWKFDYLFDGWLAVEKDGQVHRIKDKFDRDLEKLNHAVLLGYSVLRFTNDQFEDGSALLFIKKVLNAETDQP